MSICPYCGVGCGVEIGVAEDRVIAVRGMKDHPVNRGDLCALGANLLGMLHADGRLLHPMKRVGNSFERIGWDEARRTVAHRISDTIAEHGPDAFAMYVSASEHVEEYYVYNKLVKGCLGTNNLESSARLCWASGVTGLVQAFGADSPPCAYDDLEHADLFVVSGYNPASSKPVLFRRLLAAKRGGAAKLIVIDPRTTPTAAKADAHLRIAPGTDVALHNAIAHVLIRDGFVDEEEARRLTRNYDQLEQHVAQDTPAHASRVTGLREEQITEVARMIGRADAALFLWGQGLNQSRVGTRKVTTLLNLAFMTGNVGKPGAGPLAVTGQSGAMALREVGALPHLLPGLRLVSDDNARSDIGDIWGVDPDRIAPKPGKTLPEILRAIGEGTIKALWVIHANPAATFPDTAWARSVLARTEFLVVQDCYHPTETSRLAHIVLPAAQWGEKTGVVTNSERGLNLVEQAVSPPGEAKADHEIVMDIAREMGFGRHFDYASTEDIFDEYRSCTAGRPCDIGGVTYARLARDKGIQWPVPTADHPGTKRRFTDRRFPDGKLALGLHRHEGPAEAPDQDYPLLLITGLVAAQFHSRTRTGRVERLNRAVPEPFVEIHPRDAEELAVDDGDRVEVSSRRGRIHAVARVTETMREGAIFVPYHFGDLAGPDQAVNSLTIRSFDERAHQPEFKACAARVAKAPGSTTGGSL
jgi:anaerobic selenocysteine-containing dehydrogenase